MYEHVQISGTQTTGRIVSRTVKVYDEHNEDRRVKLVELDEPLMTANDQHAISVMAIHLTNLVVYAGTNRAHHLE